MNYFLIDYENVNVAGFDGLSSLGEGDIIVVFYSINAETLTFGLHNRINKSKANIQFQKISAGTANALDFQLCSYLGFLIRDTYSNEIETGESATNKYYIVSCDQGYAVLSEYWKKRGFDVSVVANLRKDLPKPVVNAVKVQNPTPVVNVATFSGDDKAVRELQDKLSGIVSDKNNVMEIMKIIKQNKTKTAVHAALGKKFSSKGDKLYGAIRTLIADKPGQ